MLGYLGEVTGGGNHRPYCTVVSTRAACPACAYRNRICRLLRISELNCNPRHNKVTYQQRSRLTKQVRGSIIPGLLDFTRRDSGIYQTNAMTIHTSSTPNFFSFALTKIRAVTKIMARICRGNIKPSTMCARVGGAVMSSGSSEWKFSNIGCR